VQDCTPALIPIAGSVWAWALAWECSRYWPGWPPSPHAAAHTPASIRKLSIPPSLLLLLLLSTCQINRQINSLNRAQRASSKDTSRCMADGIDNGIDQVFPEVHLDT